MPYRLGLHNAESDTEADGEKGDNGREGSDGILCHLRPEYDHCPRLVHQSRLHDNSEEHGEDIGCHADLVVTKRNIRKVIRIEDVKVEELGSEERSKKSRPDSTDDKTENMQHARRSAQLGRGRHGKNDTEHDDAGTDLCAIVESDADAFDEAEVNGRYRGVDLGLAVTVEEGDVL